MPPQYLLFLIGIPLGVLMQVTLLLNLENGEFQRLSPRRRWGRLLVGAVAAALTGMAALAAGDVARLDGRWWATLVAMCFAAWGGEAAINRLVAARSGGSAKEKETGEQNGS